MSLNLNQVTVSGRLSRNSECRALQSGSRVVTFTIFVQFSLRRTDDGKWIEEGLWIDVNKWYANENIVPIELYQGDEVLVTGRLQGHTFKPKDSEKEIQQTRIVADIVRLATPSKNRPQNEGQPQQQGAIPYGQPQNGYGNAPQGYAQQPQQQYASPAQRAAAQYLPPPQYSPVEAYARQQQQQQQAQQPQGNPNPQGNTDEGDLPF